MTLRCGRGNFTPQLSGIHSFERPCKEDSR